MDEQHGGGEQPGAWEAWTTPPGQPQPAEPDRARDPAAGAPAGSGDPAAASPQPAQPDPPGPPAPLTQPIGFPPAGYGYPAGGGHGQPPGGGYGQPPGGGYGQPPGGGYGGGYGMPPGYGGPPRRRRGLATVITYLAVAALAATAGGLVVSFADTGSNSPGASAGPNGNGGNFGLPNNGFGNGSTSPSASGATLQKVEDAVLPGVVVINSSLQYDGTGVSAAGTGMIISKSGLVLTNNHVIDQTTGLTATVVTTGRKYPARWLGYDKGSDIAVIQLEGASGLTTVPLGDSSTVKVGQSVVGLGNAGGTGRITPATGTITGINQTITASDQGSGAPPERLTDMLQTNADIIQGDSGGPLATTAGKVIGMDTAASTNGFTSQSQDVGFAIPINRAMTIARQIIAGKSSSSVQIGSSGFVGVLVAGGPNNTQSTEASPQAQLQQEEQAQGGLPNVNPSVGCVESNQSAAVPARIASVSSGTLILGTICGTPAAQAGMIPGDVITKVAGQQVTSPASLMSILHGVHGGSAVSITWVTPSDQSMTRTLTVGAAPPA